MDSEYQKTGTLLSLSLVLILVAILFNTPKSNAYEASLSIASEFSINDIDSPIIDILATPNSKEQYLLLSQTGQVFHLNRGILNNLGKLPSKLKNQNSLVENQRIFTSFAINPSFSLTDQAGFHTFYTAHVETNKNTQHSRFLDKTLDEPASAPFDTVITEWRLSSNIEKARIMNQQREILRIGIFNKNKAISQLAFNPFINVWEHNYGYLYITLKADENIKNSALYSGTVLRINPTGFGLKPYTAPKSNPFTKNTAINNEFILLGASEITGIFWQKQQPNYFFIDHSTSNSHYISRATFGDDWRNSQADEERLVLNNAIQQKQLTLYQGRALKNQRGKLLALIKNDNNWQLKSFFINNKQAPFQSSDTFPSAEISQKSFILEEIQSNQLSLHTQSNGELLLFDHDNKRLIALEASNELTSVQESSAEKENQATESQNNNQSSSGNNYGKFLLFLFLIVLAGLFIRLRPKVTSLKYQLNHQFSRFEIDKINQSLLLFKRHQKEASVTLKVVDLIESEIFLNDGSVALVKKRVDHAFSAKKEDKLRQHFTNEHRNKMVDHKLRKVRLDIIDKHQEIFSLYLYARKGNKRLTKDKYFDVLEKVIDWSWLFSGQINPDSTEKRKIKVVNVPVQRSENQTVTQDNYQLQEDEYTQPEAYHTYSDDIIESNYASTSEHTSNVSDTNSAIDDTSKAQALRNQINDTTLKSDAELVSQLDKLTRLKQKGYLTEEEFSLAKAKILQNINDE